MEKLCKHSGTCGGCSFQDVPYPEQLKRKEALVKALFSNVGLNPEIKPIRAYPESYYRNKMEFAFSQGSSGLILGLYGKDHKIMDLDECRIFSEDTGLILKSVKAFAAQQGWPAYDKYSYRGLLRHLIVRQTKFTNQTMLGIVTTTQQAFDAEGFSRAMSGLKLAAPLKSLYWIINDSVSDAVVFEKKMFLSGQEYIQEDLNGFIFDIGIDTFAQVNPRAAADFYQAIRGYAGLSGSQDVLDLFCGSGGIGMFLAGQAKSVLGVELSPEIVEAARRNASQNNIANISFFAQDARKFLNASPELCKDVQTLVLNPPRSGVCAKLVRTILRGLTPETIIYSSCNPATQAQDLKLLSEAYGIELCQPFDFFPHTRHVECLAVLQRGS